MDDMARANREQDAPPQLVPDPEAWGTTRPFRQQHPALCDEEPQAVEPVEIEKPKAQAKEPVEDEKPEAQAKEQAKEQVQGSGLDDGTQGRTPPL